MVLKCTPNGVLMEFYGNGMEFLCTTMEPKWSFEKQQPAPLLHFTNPQRSPVYF